MDTEDKKSFLEKIQSLEDSTKRRILIVATVVSMLIVVYVWLGYFNGLLANIDQTPVADAGQQQSSGGATIWGSMKDGMANMINTLRGPGQYIIKPN